MTPRARRGVTLIELLIALVISGIAMMAIAMPFVAERAFWRHGMQQTQAQRDAQLAMRAIARAARGSTGYTISSSGPSKAKITFATSQVCAGNNQIFDGGPNVGSGALTSQCGSNAAQYLINRPGDQTGSKVTELRFQSASTSNRVHIIITVTTKNNESERLETDVYLRNAT